MDQQPGVSVRRDGWLARLSRQQTAYSRLQSLVGNLGRYAAISLEHKFFFEIHLRASTSLISGLPWSYLLIL
jgi:hypothetical protein